MLPPFFLRSLATSSPFVQAILAQQNLVGVLGVQAGILLTELFRLRQQRLATLLLLLLIGGRAVPGPPESTEPW